MSSVLQCSLMQKQHSDVLGASMLPDAKNAILKSSVLLYSLMQKKHYDDVLDASMQSCKEQECIAFLRVC
eukprot:1158702-Pelagomonas_calceolata.AAC.17